MGGADASMSSTKSQPGGKRNPPDEQKWHPGRHLSYHWKRDHDFLRQQVEMKNIAYNTEFDLEIEHCEMERNDKSFSLRPSYQGGRHSGGPEYNRYAKLCDDLRQLCEEELATTETGEAMWTIAVHQNDRRKTLLPRSVDESKRKPRPGSFEVILSWKSANLGSRLEAVLFSKLNTLKFPNPPDIIAYIKRELAPVRMLAFKVLARNVPDGLPVSGGLAEVDVGEDEPVHSETDRNGVVDLQLPFQKDLSCQVAKHCVALNVTLPYTAADFDDDKQASFKAAVASASEYDDSRSPSIRPTVVILAVTESQSPSKRRAGSIAIETKISAADIAALTRQLGTGDALSVRLNRKLKEQSLNESTSAEASLVPDLLGAITFDVHGDLPKSICTPLVPVHSNGEVRVVLTWGEFPHNVVLKVKTPEGAIQTPDQTPESAIQTPDQAPQKDQLQGVEKLPNAEFECRPGEGGFGPISVLLRTLLPGRYHVYARCTAYDVAGKEIGWADSNAQVVMYGHEQESLEWSGDYSFKCKREEDFDADKEFWNICFFDVNDNGHVTVSRVFNEFVAEEPGFRMSTIRCKDMLGRPVQNATVKCMPESAAYSDMGDLVFTTDENGSVEVQLPFGSYTAQVTHDDYLPTAAAMVVDLEPQVSEVVVALVKEEYFAGDVTGDYKLVVLTWGGSGRAVLHVETPGRLFVVPPEEDEEKSYATIQPSTTMKMRGTNPRGCIITPPNKAVCPWTDEALYKDQIFVEYDGEEPMESTNMQLSIFGFSMVGDRKECGIIYSASPKVGDADSRFWKVCAMSNGECFEKDERVLSDPSSGGEFSVRVLPAKAPDSEESPQPSPEVIITREGDALPIRSYLSALQNDDAEFTAPLEYKLFLPYGTYKIESKDESWIMMMPNERNPDRQQNLPYNNLLFTRSTENSVGLCMASQEDVDARSLFISLTWAGQPLDLDLCVAHADGVVSSQQAGKGAPKGITYVSTTDKGYGPKVVSLMQPITGKYKVYVTDRSKSDPKTFLKCHPMVNVTFFNQIWQSFTLSIPTGATHAEELDMQIAGGQAPERGSKRVALKWEELTQKPDAGAELNNDALASDLKGRTGKLEFSKTEWDSFQVSNLASDSYIAAGDRYFKPAAITTYFAGSNWHVFDLKVDQDTKMSESCVEIAPVNELLDAEPKFA